MKRQELRQLISRQCQAMPYSLDVCSSNLMLKYTRHWSWGLTGNVWIKGVDSLWTD